MCNYLGNFAITYACSMTAGLCVEVQNTEIGIQKI